MKIKFIKEYRALSGESLWNCAAHSVGAVLDVIPVQAQWLINNGFAEKVEDRWPREGDKYWLVDTDGNTVRIKWENDEQDDKLKAIGNVFKTEELARRFIDYLKAVETVRHDEGFMKIRRKINYDTYGYAISQSDWNKSLIAEKVESINHAGQFYFDTSEHAEASLDKHRDEWRTIFDYDWSKE